MYSNDSKLTPSVLSMDVSILGSNKYNKSKNYEYAHQYVNQRQPLKSKGHFLIWQERKICLEHFSLL